MSDRNENESGFGAFLAGFIIGGLVGAAVALILAPQSGEDTRTQFSARGVEWRDRVNQNRHQWSQNVSEMTHSASETLGSIDINSVMRRKSSQQEEDEGTES
jgi:gas vesicle protein